METIDDMPSKWREMFDAMNEWHEQNTNSVELVATQKVTSIALTDVMEALMYLDRDQPNIEGAIKRLMRLQTTLKEKHEASIRKSKDFHANKKMRK